MLCITCNNEKKILRFTLILLGIYAAYIGIGMMLTSAGTIKSWPVFYNKALVHEADDTESSLPGPDGPHVFYEGSNIVVKQIVRAGDTVKLEVDTFLAGQRDSIVLQCAVEADPSTRFSTSLQSAPAVQPVEYAQPDSLIAISDIEGNFAAFKKLLMANRIIDTFCRWTFGSGHLVLTGDFFDRGKNVTECLWLIYSLEQQAEKQGGKVHFILGNHELMNMSGDLRYVNGKYIANTYVMKANYKTWFTENTELGRWLKTKNVVEKIGPLIFVHGGLSPEVIDLNLKLDEINQLCRRYYFDDHKSKRSTLTGAAKTLYDSKTSPFWYRGYVNEETEEAVVSKALTTYHARQMIVGHTLVDEITSFYNGKVIAIDTKHAEARSQGILLAKDRLYTIDTTGRVLLLDLVKK